MEHARKIKRFGLPKCSPAKKVDIRELVGRDELEAAQMADATADQKTAASLVAAERREAIRISIVRIDDRLVDPTIPLFEIDTWPRGAQVALERFFGAVNGVKEAEIRQLIKEAELLSDGTGRHGKRFRLPEGCDLESIEIWEIGGHEELAAARAVDASAAHGFVSSTILQRRAMISTAIRGRDPMWDTWTLRTSTAISLFFEDVNGIPEEEISGLLAGAVDVGAESAETISPPVLEEGASASATG